MAASPRPSTINTPLKSCSFLPALAHLSPSLSHTARSLWPSLVPHLRSLAAPVNASLLPHTPKLTRQLAHRTLPSPAACRPSLLHTRGYWRAG